MTAGLRRRAAPLQPATASDRDAAGPATIWTPELVKELLRHPHRLINSDPHGSWIARRGGLPAVYQALSALPLADDERRLLTALLDEPRASAKDYAARLGLSRASYFIHLKQLLDLLTAHLNAWQLGTSQPAAGSLAAAPAPRLVHLPAPLTSFVGREQELAHLRATLLRPDVRMLTLTGVGGTGKTRLALQVAAELADAFRSGVCWVALASIHDPALVLPTIAQTLGLRESGSLSLLEVLASALRDRELLLVLDNLEQLLDAAPRLIRLLEEAPRLTMLVTSRTSLHVSAEHIFEVPPLSVPDLKRLPAHHELAQSPAVALFLARVQAVQPSFSLASENAAAVAQICARLDGLPLAIELAAARCRLLTPTDLATRLDNRLGLLTGGPRDLPARQQTLRAAIDWSYDLLAPAEQLLFARLGIFSGGCTLEAVETICSSADAPGSDTLEGTRSLIDKSMLQHEAGSAGLRLRMLEIIREYAVERLAASGELEQLRSRHAHYYLALAQQAEAQLQGPEQVQWFERLEQEHDNFREALRWLLEQRQADALLQLASLLSRFWFTRGYLSEGRRWLERALSTTDQHDRSVRARALNAAGILATEQGEYSRARQYFEECLALHRASGNARGTLKILHNLGNVMLEQAEYAASEAAYKECLTLAQQLSYPRETALALLNLGRIAYSRGHYEPALQALNESLARCQEIDDLYSESIIMGNIGLVLLYQGQLQSASGYFERCVALARELGSKRELATGLAGLGSVALAGQDFARARALLQEALTIAQELGHLWSMVQRLEELGELASATGQLEQAARIFGAAERLRERINTPLPPARQQHYNHVLAVLRSQLDEVTLNALWSEGRALRLDEVIAYALQPEQPS